ncbi:MAG: glycosyltransferase family 4 protein [Anaerolineae bacterium]
MHVAVSGWFWNRPETGSGQYVQQLVRALPEVDPALKLTVVLPQAPTTLASTSSHLKFVVHPTPLSNLRKVWWEQVWMPRFAARVRADLLHIPYWAPPIASSLPCVVTIHDIIPLVLRAYRGDFRVRLYTSFVAAATPCTSMILTDSDAAREDIIEHLKVAADLIRTVPLAAQDIYTHVPAPADEEMRESLALPRRYVLYLGGFDARKNLKTLFEAFSIAHEAGIEAKLVVGGRLPSADTPFTPDPRGLAREAGVSEDAVCFLGFVPEQAAPAVYRGAHTFVFPSVYEGFGLPPLEALSCGVPVVGSAATSIPEVVGAAGVLLDPDDAEGMAGALIQLLNDDAFHVELRRRALEQAKRFDWQRTAKATLAAYQATLSQGLGWKAPGAQTAAPK